MQTVAFFISEGVFEWNIEYKQDNQSEFLRCLLRALSLSLSLFLSLSLYQDNLLNIAKTIKDTSAILDWKESKLLTVSA